MLWLNIGEIAIERLMNNERSTFRWAELPRGPVHGFAPEDKVHGGDIYLKLSCEAGKGVKAPGRGFGIPTFNIQDISDTTEEFKARGLETILLPSLWAVENERRRSELPILPWD